MIKYEATLNTEDNTMDIKDLVSVEEAAKILGYEKSSVTLLCRKGKLEGAFRIGHQWMIPRTVIENYEKAPQGFAAVWARRREAEKAQLEAELAAEPEIVDGVDDKESLEREILQTMKVLVKKIIRLEKMIYAQEKFRA